MTLFKTAEARLDGAAYTLRRTREAFEFRRSDRNRLAFEAAEEAYEAALAAFASVRNTVPYNPVAAARAVLAARQGDLFA